MPQIHQSAYIDQTAIICGKVIIHANVFVGPYAVIRADETDENGDMEPIVIGANSNIQDGVVIHSKAGAAVQIGENSSIAHRSIIHGPCVIGARVLSVLTVCYSIAKSVTTVPFVIMPLSMDVIYRLTLCPCHELYQRQNRLGGVSPIDVSITEFSESVVTTNIELVQGYKALSNEF